MLIKLVIYRLLYAAAQATALPTTIYVTHTYHRLSYQVDESFVSLMVIAGGV